MTEMTRQQEFEEELENIIDSLQAGIAFFYPDKDIGMMQAGFVEYDDRNVGTDATINLKIRVQDIYGERDKEMPIEDALDILADIRRRAAGNAAGAAVSATANQYVEDTLGLADEAHRILDEDEIIGDEMRFDAAMETLRNGK